MRDASPVQESRPVFLSVESRLERRGLLLGSRRQIVVAARDFLRRDPDGVRVMRLDALREAAPRKPALDAAHACVARAGAGRRIDHGARQPAARVDLDDIDLPA